MLQVLKVFSPFFFFLNFSLALYKFCLMYYIRCKKGGLKIVIIIAFSILAILMANKADSIAKDIYNIAEMPWKNSKIWRSKPNFLLLWTNFMAHFWMLSKSALMKENWDLARCINVPTMLLNKSWKVFPPKGHFFSWRALNPLGIALLKNIHPGIYICVTHAWFSKLKCIFMGPKK